MSSAERLVLPRDVPAGAPGTVAYAGVDPTLEGRARQHPLRPVRDPHQPRAHEERATECAAREDGNCTGPAA